MKRNIRISTSNADLTVYLEPIPFEFNVKSNSFADIQFRLDHLEDAIEIFVEDNHISVSGSITAVFVDGDDIYNDGLIVPGTQY